MRVEYIPTSPPTKFQWEFNPLEVLPNILGVDGDLDDDLDGQLCFQLLHSEIVAGAWEKDDTHLLKVHPELQLIHHLEDEGIDVVCDAIGISKPPCWTCCTYLESRMNAGKPQNDDTR